MSANQPWPLREAADLLKHIEALEARGLRAPTDPVLFETGYGPSGLPHIGTFAEVARTTFIRRAFRQLSDRPTKLIAFSDDMDGLRKVPLNIPDPERVAPHLGKPLSSIPDPFGVDDSYSAHMNRRLREFLDRFGFDYSFQSSTATYASGAFNHGLRTLLQRVDAVLDIILPTLRPESREGWSPFMPICPGCGRNLTTRVTAYHPERDALSYACDATRYENLTGCGRAGEISVLDGHVKVGWKVDWAMRWFTLGIHYEMYGKDLIESARLSARIVKALGGEPPIGLFYEMFLDEDGRKISKSVGRGVSVDRWMSYAPIESLLAFLYQNPRKAKRLTYDTIPLFTDQYLKQLSEWEEQDAAGRLWNPSYFYFRDDRPRPRWTSSVNYSLVRNLVVCMGKNDPDTVMEYLARYDASVQDADHDALARGLVRGALAYDRDFEAGGREREAPALELVPAVRALAAALDEAATQGKDDPEELQGLAFTAAREAEVEARALFTALYRGLIGQDRGPRFGSFMLALGLAEAATALRGLATRALLAASPTLALLEELRAHSGAAQTLGLDDATIARFGAPGTSLATAVEQAVERHRSLRERWPQLAGDEATLIRFLQEDFVNFYTPATINPYVPMGGKGPWVVTSHGAVLHDNGGYGMLGMGHAPGAILEVMSQPWVMANVMTASVSQKRLAERLRDEVGHRRADGCPFARFLCLNSGSEAVTVAARFSDLNARSLTAPGARHEGRTIKFLALRGAFHGRTDRPAQASHSSRHRYEASLASFRGRDNLIVVPPNDVQALRDAFAQADADGVFIEAMFMEPVMGEGNPGLAMTRPFYDAARELTAAMGSLLIVDSIQAGLRTRGVLSIVDYPGFEDCVIPDLETWSKALNAGQFPLSVIGVSESAAALYVTGIYGNTMTSNPRSCEVACAVLDALTPAVRANILTRGQAFMEGLRALQLEFPTVIQSIQGTGLLFCAELNPDTHPVIGFSGVEAACRRVGLGVIHGGRNALRFTPWFGIGEEEVALVLGLLHGVLTTFEAPEG